MSNSAPDVLQPPKLVRATDGSIENNSLADLIEWFLVYDERTSRIRHPMIDELFNWKQQDDEANGVGTYPFENAEARFAIGVFQALAENNSEPLLNLWLSDVLNALQEAKNTREEISTANKLEDHAGESHFEKADRLTTNAERRMYLASCWLETLLTAEARVLGWVYQEIYGKAFQPAGSNAI
jgi:hypothetical protein